MLITSTTIQSENDPNLKLVLTRNDDPDDPADPQEVLVEWKRADGTGSSGPLIVFDPTDSDEKQFEDADCVAAEIWGRDRKGRAAATNSMIHDVWRVLKQIAGM